ncbi:N-acetyl-gamma-glutamyl-phosphate reductase [Ferrimonas senticii]|uniref:N-acetyl-gamma-glutamyl-phosphate reductase n=1 Tax=Ferrimonas senticii TaxID=394566 RepID=UPI00040E3A18|nr:N-acetyl-gamma-glutamyl-phosphate reductase [Ferrimonas senticii]
MTKVAIIGASGYAGAQLAQLIQTAPQFTLHSLFVSAASADLGKPLAQLYPHLHGIIDLPLIGIDEQQISALGDKVDAVCLATEHAVSAAMVPQLLAAGVVVFDLSGAFRFADAAVFPKFYHFEHPSPQLLNDAVYGLPEWHADAIATAQLVAVPGCYPTASLLALKPLKQAGLIAAHCRPVINAVSGVSGAGRKATLANAFCQVSLSPYGVLNHRHQPEIESQLGQQVVFTPHLGAFKRGILATITVELVEHADAEQIAAAYHCYDCSDKVQLLPQGQWPKVDDVALSDRCLLAYGYQPERQLLVVAAAIDNLMKGAASQALQCMIMRFAKEEQA